MQKKSAIASVGVILATSGVAVAQNIEDDAEEAYQDAKETLFGRGLAVMAGVGVENFSSSTVGDTTGTGGTWDVRVISGERSRIALEAAYIGSAANIDAQLGNDSGTLVGTTIEVIGRVHMVPDQALRPYGLVGLGWRRYDVAGTDFETSSAGLEDSDNLLTMPIGVGVSYRFDALGVPNLLADARADFRLNMGPDLVPFDPNDRETDRAAMHTWDISVRAGYAF